MNTGADISHHQASFDAATYKRSGEDFIILKATEGKSHVDDQFASRWRNANAVMLPRVAYHYAHPSNSPIDESNHFAAIVRNRGWQAGDAWALDLEITEGASPATLLRWADDWCNNVRHQLGGKGLFYTFIAFLFGELENPGRVPGGCLGWIARYRTDSPYAAPFERPDGWADPPPVWQCSNGISGCVKDVASIGRCDYNHMTDSAFRILFEGAGMPSLDDTDLSAIDGIVKKYRDTIVGFPPFEDRIATLSKIRADTTRIAGEVDDTEEGIASLLLAFQGTDPTVIAAALRASLSPETIAALKAIL